MHEADISAKRLPSWLKRPIGRGGDIESVKRLLRKGKLHTVCEEARCPNLGECFGRKQATFLILGDLCTRSCGFCAVRGGTPVPLDSDEPFEVAETVESLGIAYAVITSVTRDDLADGGAGHFAETIREIRRLKKETVVEVLTPDFEGREEAINAVCLAGPDVYNHNVETVPSLYEKVRPQALFERSLEVIRFVKKKHPGIVTKSGLMLGFGERRDEVVSLLEELKEAGCDLVTIGQYMQPTKAHLPVMEYVEPERFRELEIIGKKIGFRGIYAAPLVRSSYNAENFNKEVSLGRILQN